MTPILLLSPRRAHDATLIAALQPLVGAIPVEPDARSQYARVERHFGQRCGALAGG